MASVEQKLLSLKQKIESAKTEKSKLDGAMESLKKRLLDEFGCKTVKQAEKKIEEMKEKLKSLNNDIQEKLKSIEEEYGDLL